MSYFANGNGLVHLYQGSRSMECRIIREHRVFGKVVYVEASSEHQARILAPQQEIGTWAWEAKEVGPGRYEVFVARHQDCFALND